MMICRIFAAIMVLSMAWLLASIQFVGFYRGRRFDQWGKSQVCHRGWPLVFSEAYYGPSETPSKFCPDWDNRLAFDLILSAAAVLSAGIGTYRLLSHRLQFRIGTLLLLITVIATEIALDPIMRSALTPQAEWGFDLALNPKFYFAEIESPKGMAAVVASVSLLYAAFALSAHALKRAAAVLRIQNPQSKI